MNTKNNYSFVQHNQMTRKPLITGKQYPYGMQSLLQPWFNVVYSFLFSMFSFQSVSRLGEKLVKFHRTVCFTNRFASALSGWCKVGLMAVDTSQCCPAIGLFRLSSCANLHMPYVFGKVWRCYMSSGCIPFANFNFF